MRMYLDEEKIYPNIAFALYFSTMFCLYTHTYIQLFSQIGIILYTLVIIIRRAKILKRTMKILVFYLLWYGLFLLMMYISKRWAFSINANSKTILTVFRILIIGMFIILYADTNKRVFQLLLSFLFGCAILGLVFLITTILSGGTLGTNTAGLVIGQHRNQVGAVTAPATFICYYLGKIYYMKHSKEITIFFLVLTLLTGSRTSILQLVLIYAFIALFTERGITKTVKKTLQFILALFFSAVIIYEIPFFFFFFWERIINALLTLSKVHVFDRSVQGREAYKRIALMMFLKKPILGYGLDGFSNYLREYPTIIGWHLSAVQSHCNYAELAADFGVLGLMIWYIPVLKWLCIVYKGRRKNDWCGCLFGVITSMNVLDYSRIPWDTHLVMYLFIIMLLLTFYAFMNQPCEKMLYHDK